MSNDEDDVVRNSIPNGAVWLLIASAGTGGVGFGTYSSSKLDATALSACYDNSRIAITTSADHSREFVHQQSEIDENKSLIYARTQSRFTKDDHREYQAQQARRDAAQDRQLELLTNEVRAAKR